MSDYSVLDELSKVGLAYGAFFAFQAAGYARGLKPGEELVASFDMKNFITSGIAHLAHFFNPRAPYAWPLTPAVLAVLLLYALYWPSFDSLGGEMRWFNHTFVALLLVSSYFALLGAIIGSQSAARIADKWWFASGHSGHVTYFVFYVLATPALCWGLDAYGAIYQPPTGPWAKIIGLALVGWIQLLVFLGAEYDGAVDRLNVSKIRLHEENFRGVDVEIDGK